MEGEVPFEARVPFRLLLPRGPGGPAPLLVALHGKGDRADRFEAEARAALPGGWALLVPAAPIPRDRGPGRGPGSVGASWYLYDGDTPLFRASLDRAEAHLHAVLAAARRAARRRPRGTRPPDFHRTALLGFSQGAYLAGIAAVRRPEVFRAAVLVAGRLKHEILGERFAGARGLRVLALHGREDAAVAPGPSEASIRAAREAGLAAAFRLLDGAHAFTPRMRRAARAWLARLFPAAV